MSEIPIEINLTSGLIAIGVLLLSNYAIAIARITLDSEQKKTQLFNALRTLNKEYASSSSKSQKPYPKAVLPPSMILGLIDLRKTILVF